MVFSAVLVVLGLLNGEPAWHLDVQSSWPQGPVRLLDLVGCPAKWCALLSCKLNLLTCSAASFNRCTC